MPTLQDVAQRAGVSTATVSKVLSNTPYVSEETRLKVMQAIAELDYTPNLVARALSSGKTNIVTVVFPIVYDAIFTDPHVMSILEGVEAECRAQGYNILLSTPRLATSEPDLHYLQLLRSGYMDGVIAIDNVPHTSVLEPVQREGIPAVAIGQHPSAYYVRSDDEMGGQLLMAHVLELGHRCIGLIATPDSLHLSTPRRLAGARKAVQAAGLDFDALPRADGDFSTASGGRCAEQLLTEHPDLTALIALNDRMAMGAVQAARSAGYAVPERLTIVGYDDIPWAATFVPALTTMSQRAPDLGHAAAAMLFALLDGEHPEPMVLPPHLVVRHSSAPVQPNGG
jgi:DNA-binding LacI/PurR family transcriptional regulator